MKRIPEPELMDGLEQAKAYAQADFDEPHENFMTLFKQTFKQTFPTHPVEGHVLDLGCGPADISIRFARHYPNCKVLGVDGAQAMLEFGRQGISEAKLSAGIELTLAYLPTTNLPARHYSIIISNSLLHHLNDPAVLWQTIQQYGTSGSRVFVMDLMRPSSQQAAHQLVQTYAAEEPEILRQDFYASLLAAYTVDEVLTQLHQNGLNQLQVVPVSDRHLTVSGIL